MFIQVQHVLHVIQLWIGKKYLFFFILRFLNLTKCSCDSHYYEVPNDPLCHICDVKCTECITKNNTCTSCYITTQFRTLSGTSCVCLPNYWERPPENNDPVCFHCHARCKLCTSDTIDTCTVCYPEQFRELNPLTNGTSRECTC